MTTEKRMRSNYTENLKRDAVALLTEQGDWVSEAARSRDVDDVRLRKTHLAQVSAAMGKNS